MEENDKKTYKEIVENIFMRWTALKLAVEHGMGGKSGRQTAVEAMNYVYEYCIGNENVTQSEIQEILEEIMDQEFNTICEDNSAFEISSLLIKYLNMIRDKQYDAVKKEISSMPPCHTPWLNPSFKLECTIDSDTIDSDSSYSDDEEEEDEEMDTSTNNTDVQSTSKTNVPITDEDGWTMVTSKRK